MNFLSISSINKKGEKDFVLKDVTFNQQKFKKIAIAGETGSGKSTLLKIIAGLVQPDTGEVLFENERVLGPEENLFPDILILLICHNISSCVITIAWKKF